MTAAAPGLAELPRRDGMRKNLAFRKGREAGGRFISQQEDSGLTEEERAGIARLLRSENREVYESLEHPIVLGKSFYRDHVKRLLDIALSLTAVIVTAPVNLVLFIGTLIDVGFPVFFCQERIGKGGKAFRMVKFRNMTNEVDERGTLLLPEQRVTKWGRFVRSASMDELLNFWSVLKGDMSIIGPRPLPEKYRRRFTRKYDQRHLVRPGLDCPAMPGAASGDGWQGRFDNDLWYVGHVSFLTDARMCLLLVKKAFSKSERGESAEGRHGEFLGFDKNGQVVDSYRVKRETAERVSGRGLP